MDVVIRASVIFWVLWILLRATGKRELAEMTPFELILLMVSGDLIQQGVNGEDQSATGAALAVSTMMLWAVALSYASFRSRYLRRGLEARATVLARDGVVDHRALAVQRMTFDELLVEARLAGIGDLRDVAIAVLESDGRMSFVRGATVRAPADEPGSGPAPRHIV